MSDPAAPPRLRWDNWCVALLLGATVALTFWQILARHLGPVLPLPTAFKTASYTEELGRYLFVWTMLVGTAAAYSRDEHLSLDLWGKGNRAEVLLSRIRRIAWIVFGAVLVFGGGRLILLQWRTEQATTMGWPVVWVTGAVPLTGVWLIVNALRRERLS